MKAALFYYYGFAEFEVALSLLELRELDWYHIAVEKRPYKSLEGQTFLVSHTIDEVDPKLFNLILIPGGDSLPLFENKKLKQFLIDCLSNEGTVAGICGGAELLAGFGLLDGLNCTAGSTGMFEEDPLYKYFAKTTFVHSEVVVDDHLSGRIITAQGQAYEKLSKLLTTLF